MKILVLNCGSSSLKYQLIDMENEHVLTKGLCERIGIDGSVLTHKVPGKDNYVVETPMPDHSVAVQLVLDALTSAEHGVIASVDEINAIGHRVLHQGRPDLHRCGHRATAGAVLPQMDQRIHGVRPVEQLFLHGLGLHAVRADRQHDAGNGPDGHPAALYLAVL